VEEQQNKTAATAAAFHSVSPANISTVTLVWLCKSELFEIAGTLCDAEPEIHQESQQCC